MRRVPRPVAPKVPTRSGAPAKLEWTAVLGGSNLATFTRAGDEHDPRIWLGALLFFVGLLQMAFQPIWRGRLSGTKRLHSGRDTLEPEEPGSGFGINSNWPGTVLVALGSAFLLAAAAI